MRSKTHPLIVVSHYSVRSLKTTSSVKDAIHIANLVEARHKMAVVHAGVATH